MPICWMMCLGWCFFFDCAELSWLIRSGERLWIFAAEIFKLWNRISAVEWWWFSCHLKTRQVTELIFLLLTSSWILKFLVDPILLVSKTILFLASRNEIWWFPTTLPTMKKPDRLVPRPTRPNFFAHQEPSYPLGQAGLSSLALRSPSSQGGQAFFWSNLWKLHCDFHTLP